MFWHSFQPTLHQLRPPAFCKVDFVGVNFAKTLFHVLLDGLSQLFKTFVAFDHVATGGSQFDGVRLNPNFTDNSISQSVT
jgi:hypothetical protein